MNITAKRLLEIAAAELGYCEKETNAKLDNKTANAGDDNYTKYARDLHAKGYYQASKQGFEWCDMFVDWCFLQLCGGDAVKAQEVICQTGPYGAGCGFSAKYYKAQGRFYTSDPQPGDQIFFNDYAHTGIVEKVVGKVVHTIEGNTSNKVARRTYTLGSGTIDGYGRPKFETEAPGSAPKPVTGKVSTGSAADEKTIWNFLKSKGLNDYAIAGVMGNLYAESGLRSNNLEQTYERKLGYADDTYTAAVDNGSYDNFVKDCAGYGLAQWTYWTRKQNLLDFARAAKKSIADLQTQLDFLWKELQGYTAVMNVLKSADSVREASDIFMVKFENPANQSDAAKATRAGFGQKYFDKYAAKASVSTPAAEKLEEDGEWGKATTTRLQQIFGTPVDGVVSNQHAIFKAANPGLVSGWDWKDKPNGRGSALIKAMQKWAGMPVRDQDGEIGPVTIRAFQKKLGTVQDGNISRPSQMVKALQVWANNQ